MAFLLVFGSGHEPSGWRGSPGKFLCGGRARRRSCAVDPGRAVSQAVCDPVVTGIDRHARNQIGNEEMEGAATPLLAHRELSLPAFADPPGVDRCRMQARPAISLGRSFAVAMVMVLAQTALPPRRIFRDLCWRTRRVDHPFRFGDEPMSRCRIGAHSLDMDLVRILADGDIHGAGDAGQVHVDPHLRPMPRLGALDTVPFQRRE